MWLGSTRGYVKAVDNKTVYAIGHPKVDASPKKPVALKVSAPAVMDAPSTRELQLEKELKEARAMNSHLRGRVLRLLSVLRGEKRTIARLEREVAAHTSSNPLTVEQVLSSASVMN